MSDNQRGATFMMLSMAAFVLNDTFVKLLGAHIPLFKSFSTRPVGDWRIDYDVLGSERTSMASQRAGLVTYDCSIWFGNCCGLFLFNCIDPHANRQCDGNFANASVDGVIGRGFVFQKPNWVASFACHPNWIWGHDVDCSAGQ